MTTFVYDGTFEGLLTCIFESYHLKVVPDKIVVSKACSSLFAETYIDIGSDSVKATRVYDGLDQKISLRAKQMIYHVFLSELSEAEILILKYVRLAFDSKINIEENYREYCVLRMNQINKMIEREVHRMHAFVRFQKTKDDVYYSVVSPDFNVIPLIGEHFEKRYADQKWVIYDKMRRYGIFYDLNETKEIQIERSSLDEHGKLLPHVTDDGFYEDLWKEYFHSVNIPERKNIKLHLRHMPKRYWIYLPEKNVRSVM